MAERLKKQHGAEAAKQVEGAWRLAYGRKPTAAEVKTAVGTLARESDDDALARLCLVLLNTNEFLYID
jgi:hypothetical protein